MKLITIFIGIMFSFLLTGCLGTTYKVYPNPISWKYPYYQWKKGKRVVGVFLNTKENKNKIEQAIKEVLSYYKKKEGNTLKTKLVLVSISMKEAMKKCEAKVRFGFYGRYKNLYEKKQLISMCVDKYMFSPHKERRSYGYKLKVSNNCIDYTNTYKGRKYHVFMCIKTQDTGKYIAVYIQGNPYNTLSTKEFIILNNRLIKAFKKFGLKNLKKEIFLENN